VSALDDVLDLLRCPHCHRALIRAGAAVRCGEGHSFDVARQGYVSLPTGDAPPHSGDTAEMVAARERILAGGHFAPLAEAMAELAAGGGEGPALVVDLGAGSGWYLARVLDRQPAARGLAVDLSKPALRRAARAHARLAAVGCDVWRPLPLRDGVADLVLNVFAPRDGTEIARILRPGGLALVVTPGASHLEQLIEPLGLLAVDERKDERLAARLEPALRPTDRRELSWTLGLDRTAARDLAAMGPSAFHLTSAELDERVAALPQRVDVTASVTITLATSG